MSNLFPTAKRQSRQVDIVFCLDVTNSMQPCIDALKNNIGAFVDGLQKSAIIDFRLGLVAYRDLHDTKVWEPEKGTRACDEPWVLRDFTGDINIFKSWLEEKDVQAYGGGDDPESTLDAIYLAIHKFKWRENQTHRVIILFTDDDSYPALHPSTYPHRDNGLSRVLQDFETMPHAAFYINAPRLPIYEQLERGLSSADRKVFANFFPKNDVPCANTDFSKLLAHIGEAVSGSALSIKIK